MGRLNEGNEAPERSPRSLAERTFAPHVLREYALLADGERGAVIGPNGEIAWLCAPSWDSGSVFSSLIGGGGVYAVWPRARFIWGGYYEPNSLIWRSRWVTDTETITECREALGFPGDEHRLILLRRVVAVTGPADVRVMLQPIADYDERPLRALHHEPDGCWAGRVGALYLRWSGGVSAALTVGGQARPRLELNLRIPPGKPGP